MARLRAIRRADAHLPPLPNDDAAMIEHVTGNASIPTWDQGHADALRMLRSCRAFVLVTLAKDGVHPQFQSLSQDLSARSFVELLSATSEATADSAAEISERFGVDTA